MNASTTRKHSEHSDTFETFVFGEEELGCDIGSTRCEDTDDDAEFVLVTDSETPDSETCTWEECIATIKVIFLFKRIIWNC